MTSKAGNRSNSWSVAFDNFAREVKSHSTPENVILGTIAVTLVYEGMHEKGMICQTAIDLAGVPELTKEAYAVALENAAKIIRREAYPETFTQLSKPS